jgi:hypothetical protein
MAGSIVIVAVTAAVVCVRGGGKRASPGHAESNDPGDDECPQRVMSPASWEDNSGGP